MNLKPFGTLSENQVKHGLNLVIKDGIYAEAMVTFTGGTFLVAIALASGASNFQIGLLAALPTLSNVFQLVSIWLVQRYNNRKAVWVISSFFARFPLFIICALPFLFSKGTSVQVLIFLLSFHYFFGAIAGASWNSWMKDLVPGNMLGEYFSRRTRITQILSVTLSLSLAFVLDKIKLHFPQYEIAAYSLMFVVGGIFGMVSLYMMYRTPEPKVVIDPQPLLKLMRKPLVDQNFRRLLVFHTLWAFALNMATPFFSVYMIKTLGLGLSTIILLGVAGQISGIVFVKIWGRYSDVFSNKTIIRICAPAYIICVLAWSFTTNPAVTMPLLLLIHVFTGITNSGIALSLNNIGIKLSPSEDAISYLAAKNMIIAFIPALAPMLGGLMADFFSSHTFSWNLAWEGPEASSVFTMVKISGWSFFFVIGSFLALLSLHFLKTVREEGETEKNILLKRMVADLRTCTRTNVRRVALVVRMVYRPVWLTIVKRSRNLRDKY